MQPTIVNDATPNRRGCASTVRWRWTSSWFWAAIFGLSIVVLGQPVWAEVSSSLEPAANRFVQPTRGSGRIIGLNQAIRIVQEESGGQVLSAKSVRRPNGVLAHRVRVLVDGQRVMTMVVDQSGRLSRGR